MASKDNEEPEDKPDGEELKELLSELQEQQAATAAANPARPLLSPGNLAAYRAAIYRAGRDPDNTVHQALFELLEDSPEPDRGEPPADAAPTAAPPHTQRADLATKVLGLQRPRTADDQWVLGIAKGALLPDGSNWFTLVQAVLQAQPAEAIFAAWISSQRGRYDSQLLDQLASEAVAQLPTLAPFVEKLCAVHRQLYLHRAETFIAVLRGAPVDAALVRLLIALLHTMERRSTEEQRALAEFVGTVAKEQRGLAAALASQARQLRQQHPRPRGRTTYDHALAFAVRLAGRPELAATATLGLVAARSGWSGAHKEWAQALAGCDAQACLRRLLLPRRGFIGYGFGLDRGLDVVAAAVVVLQPSGAAGDALRRTLLEHEDPYLRLEVAYQSPDPLRRIVEVCAVLKSLEGARGWVALHVQRDRVLRFMQEKNARPDWDRLAGRYGRPLSPLPPPLTPLQAATSLQTCLRHRALRNLTQQGRPEHLLAALLAADLDRVLEARGHQAVWRYVPWGRWPKLRLGTLEGGWPGRSLDALLTLIPRLGQLGILAEQQLSPALAELQRIGATQFADRYPTPELLTADEQTELLAAEAAFIEGGMDRPN